MQKFVLLQTRVREKNQNRAMQFTMLSSHEHQMNFPEEFNASGALAKSQRSTESTIIKIEWLSFVS